MVKTRSFAPFAVLVPVVCVYFISSAAAHGPVDLPPGKLMSDDPIDGVLWMHIACMSIAFGLIFPTGFVLGLSRSRWHVPVQIAGTSLTALGFVLGHTHGGREFVPTNAHAIFSWFVALVLGGQVALGGYLKLHLESGFNGLVRPTMVRTHMVLGVLVPVIGYVQMVLGVIAANGWCGHQGYHMGQCAAHFIMGSSFMAYGIALVIVLKMGTDWLRKRGVSQDYYDSWAITVWGIVNTWTEHRWDEPWTHKDLQHTALGIMWWAGGALGIYTARNGQRTIFPALCIIFTGYAMKMHHQELEVSTIVHAIFGYVLMVAGATKIVEICFVAKDDNKIRPFQYLPPYLLILSGFLFMGANEEQLSYLNDIQFDPFSYTLILMSLAFFVHLFAIVLFDLYYNSGSNVARKQYYNLETQSNRQHLPPVQNRSAHTSEQAALFGRESSSSDHEQLLRTAENFELNSLLVNQVETDEDD